MARAASRSRRPTPSWPAWPTSPTSTAIRDLADAVLGGVYQGDLAVALERAAAFFRVVAAGRRSVPDGADDRRRRPRTTPRLAERNERVAGALAAAAGRWRAGTLH